jgi:hypothetical protein
LVRFLKASRIHTQYCTCNMYKIWISIQFYPLHHHIAGVAIAGSRMTGAAPKPHDQARPSCMQLPLAMWSGYREQSVHALEHLHWLRPTPSHSRENATPSSRGQLLMMSSSIDRGSEANDTGRILPTLSGDQKVRVKQCKT